MQYRSQDGKLNPVTPTERQEMPVDVEPDESSLKPSRFAVQVQDISRLRATGSDDPEEDVTISDIIGQFGIYQLSLSILTFVRFINVALMTNAGPLIAPDMNYWCCIPDTMIPQVVKAKNLTLEEYLNKKCKLDMVGNEQYACSNWTFDASSTGTTLTNAFSLVCERDYLRDTFQSVISIGVVVGSVVWGSFSDRHGRYMATKVSFLCSLISGLVSCMAKDLLTYTIARSICSFGDLGLVASLSTMLLETIGKKYRGPVCIVVYTGWAVGVMIMPWITEYFRNFKDLMLFTVIFHLLTLPWILTTGESIRWLLSNGRPTEALLELKRISRLNNFFKLSPEFKSDTEKRVDDKFVTLKRKYIGISERTLSERMKNRARFGRLGLVLESTVGGIMKINKLFGERKIALATITLVWTNFNSELFYMLFILINSDIGDNIKLNYAVGGVMEILATFLCMVMTSIMSRRLSLVSTLVTISGFCFVLTFTQHLKFASVLIMNLNKLAISTLSSFVYVVTTENFPTNLRQTGYGLSGTLGSLGAVVAPILVSQVHMTNLMLMLTILPLTAAVLIPLYLRETKGTELSDDLEG